MDCDQFVTKLCLKKRIDPIDIKKFYELKACLERKGDGRRIEKSRRVGDQNIQKFITFQSSSILLYSFHPNIGQRAFFLTDPKVEKSAIIGKVFSKCHYHIEEIKRMNHQLPSLGFITFCSLFFTPSSHLFVHYSILKFLKILKILTQISYFTKK